MASDDNVRLMLTVFFFFFTIFVEGLICKALNIFFFKNGPFKFTSTRRTWCAYDHVTSCVGDRLGGIRVRR